MELYLIRHGIAVEQGVMERDEDRPLTEQGIAKTRQVARRLQQQSLQFDLICTSPLVRAQQTAEILQTENLGDAPGTILAPISTCAALAPEGELDDWISEFAQSPYDRQDACLALVGHEPNLGEWAEILVWGQTQGKLIVKKAGIIGLKLPKIASAKGNSELFLLSSPKWLI